MHSIFLSLCYIYICLFLYVYMFLSGFSGPSNPIMPGRVLLESLVMARQVPNGNQVFSKCQDNLKTRVLARRSAVQSGQIRSRMMTRSSHGLRIPSYIGALHVTENQTKSSSEAFINSTAIQVLSTRPHQLRGKGMSFHGTWAHVSGGVLGRPQKESDQIRFFVKPPALREQCYISQLSMSP